VSTVREAAKRRFIHPSLQGDTIVAAKTKAVIQKNAGIPSLKAASQSDTRDDDIIQAAYGEAVKNQFSVLVGNYMVHNPDADEMFTTGLKSIRAARQRALELVKA
jgi:hypothetical protein